MKTQSRKILMAALALTISGATLAGGASAANAKSGTPTAPNGRADAGSAAKPTAPSPTDIRKNDQWKRQQARAAQVIKGDTGGSYVDASGRLVVTTTTPGATTAAAKAGLTPDRVDDSAARMDHVMDVLNAWSRTHSVGSVQGWRVDVAGNSVVVTTTRGAHDAQAAQLASVARGFGKTVRFEVRDRDQTAQPTTAALYGGLEYVPGAGFCSIGFSALDSLNRSVWLTAGHCLSSRPTSSRGGYYIGTTRAYRYGGQDWGVINNSYPSYWKAYAAVARYNGTTMAVRGSWGNPPVGATVCKSGRTTGWTCGTIGATNVTRTYTGGVTLYGLVQHNACVEEGDSGGSVVSTGGYAVGLTSGAALYSANGRKNCGQRLGYANTSYYQPIAPALIANNLRLLVSN
jgi:streptogrisin C